MIINKILDTIVNVSNIDTYENTNKGKISPLLEKNVTTGQPIVSKNNHNKLKPVGIIFSKILKMKKNMNFIELFDFINNKQTPSCFSIWL